VYSLHCLLLFIATKVVFRFFRRLGIFGLFLFSALDSSFLVLPFGNDLLLTALVSADRSGVSWIGYVLASVAGSLLGVLLVDILMRKTGEKGLERFATPEKVEQIKRKIENKAGLTVFVATVLPPPFPFTLVIMTAAALQYPRRKLMVAVLLGRLVRFTLEAVLALYFGRRVIRYVNSDMFAYFVYVLIAVAAVASAWSLLKFRQAGVLRTSSNSP
jgi:membrane protein YqaA with SNARE-associated domain